MKIDYVKIGKRIKSKRLELELTQAQLAEMCNISNVYISHIENGSAKVSLEVLFNIANCLNSTPDYFLMDSLYTSKEYITDEIAVLLKNCDNQKLHLIEKLIHVVIE